MSLYIYVGVMFVLMCRALYLWNDRQYELEKIATFLVLWPLFAVLACWEFLEEA